ncbi:hypothetical protein AMTR_s00014p00093880 [Amborella trichopoda]|uniref:Uncharacterized protein n=1 Tax=Amborella trichopoda TaxID=13333 RepID=W1PGH1_AMBTC|nr:hypothetical protein AMTR_s00014p00093880 [Amborella trichopoda]
MQQSKHAAKLESWSSFVHDTPEEMAHVLGKAPPKYTNIVTQNTLSDISLLCIARHTFTHPQGKRDFIPRIAHTLKKRHLSHPSGAGYPLLRKKK